MKCEFEFSESELATINDTNATALEQLAIFKRKLAASTNSKKLEDLMSDLRLRFLDICNYVFVKSEGYPEIGNLMKAYKKEYVEVEEDLRFNIVKIIEGGYDDTYIDLIKTDLFVIQNRVRRVYDKAENVFCENGIAFVDINEKRVGIDNCIDKIVEIFVMDFETDENILGDYA